MRTLLALILALSLPACGREARTYPPRYEANFMQACQAQGSTESRCACIWDRIEAEIAPDSFAALEQLPGPEREAHPLMQQIQDYGLACQAPAAPAGNRRLRPDVGAV